MNDCGDLTAFFFIYNYDIAYLCALPLEKYNLATNFISLINHRKEKGKKQLVDFTILMGGFFFSSFSLCLWKNSLIYIECIWALRFYLYLYL